MFALAASVQELVLFLQKHLKIDVVSYSASVGSSRPMFSLSPKMFIVYAVATSTASPISAQIPVVGVSAPPTFVLL
jgi:hypothetical protein